MYAVRALTFLSAFAGLHLASAAPQQAVESRDPVGIQYRVIFPGVEVTGDVFINVPMFTVAMRRESIELPSDFESFLQSQSQDGGLVELPVGGDGPCTKNIIVMPPWSGVSGKFCTNTGTFPLDVFEDVQLIQ